MRTAVEIVVMTLVLFVLLYMIAMVLYVFGN